MKCGHQGCQLEASGRVVLVLPIDGREHELVSLASCDAHPLEAEAFRDLVKRHLVRQLERALYLLGCEADFSKAKVKSMRFREGE